MHEAKVFDQSLHALSMDVRHKVQLLAEIVCCVGIHCLLCGVLVH
jgi:hypothetical protein